MLCIFFSFKATFSLYYLFFIIIPIIFFVFLIIKKKYILLTSSILLLSFFCTYTFLYVKNFQDNSYNGITYTISGKICTKQNYFYSTNLILTNVTLINENGQKNNLKGNLTLSITEGSVHYDVGYTAVFEAEIEPVELVNFNDEINTYYVKNNIKYSVVGKVSAYNTTFIEGGKPLNQTIKDYNKKLLIDNFGETNGNLAYALLYGDRTEVDSNLMDTFKYSGVVHIFAVSGLHISIIVAIIFFILRKLKCNNKLILLISAILLLFYCYLCSYSPSVVRATIMALTVLLSKIVFRKNDPLTTLSLSGLIILILSPLSLFNAGFQMTFCSVFGIIIFMDIFKKVKIKNKLFKNMFLLVAVSLSTQIALLPLFAKYYGYYSTWSIFSNLLTLPLFSIFYPILFVTNLICLALNFMGFLFILPNAILSVIIYINKLVTYIPFGQFPIYYCGGVIVILYYLYLFFVSKFIIINKKIKPVVAGLGFVLVFCLFSFNTLPFVSNSNTLAFASSHFSNNYSAVIFTEKNRTYLINPNMSTNSLNKISDYLNTKRIPKINGIIFSNQQFFEAASSQSFMLKYKPKLFLPEDNNAISNLKQMDVNVTQIKYNELTKIDEDIKIEYFNLDNQFSALLFCIDNFLYLEISFKPDSYLKREILEEFILTNINFRVNCVKLNDSSENENYYRELINSNYYVFNGNYNLTLTI